MQTGLRAASRYYGSVKLHASTLGKRRENVVTVHVVCDFCRSEHEIAAAFAGQQVVCPECQSPIDVSLAEEESSDSELWDSQIAPAFRRDRFLFRQKHLAITAEKYEVWDDNGETILFVERPAYIFRQLVAIFVGMAILFGCLVLFGIFAVHFRNNHPGNEIVGVALMLFGLLASPAAMIMLMPKRHIHFYSNVAKIDKLLDVYQDRKIVLLNATYTLAISDGAVLAKLHKNYLTNIFRKRWYIYAPDGSEIAIAREDSVVRSMLRRVLGPMFGLLRTNFVIHKPDLHTLLGEFNRNFTLLDRYVLDLTSDTAGYLDRRIAVALGVMLDTGERR